MIFTTRLNRSLVYRSVAVIAVVIQLLSPAVITANIVGRSGNTYRIAEPDALRELEEKAASIDPDRLVDKKEMTRKIEGYRPFNAVSLPPAKKDRTFLVDMTYTLEFDIPDGKGGVLYPKGFVFNPLEYIPFSRTLVVLNGKAKNEIEWFESSEYRKRADVMLLVTDGQWKELSSRYKRAVFFLTAPVAERFRLAATPSIVVKKDKRYMEVREVHVPLKKDKNHRD